MVLTLNLPESLSKDLEKRAVLAGASVSDYIILELQRLQAIEPDAEMHPVVALANRVRSASQTNAEEVLPADFARNHDHYIHGANRYE